MWMAWWRISPSSRRSSFSFSSLTTGAGSSAFTLGDPVDRAAHRDSHAFSGFSYPVCVAADLAGRLHRLDHAGDQGEPGTNVQAARDRRPGAATGWLSAGLAGNNGGVSALVLGDLPPLGFLRAFGRIRSAALDFLSPSCHSY